MKHCQGCGGILGKDCFNEQECISISMQQASYDEHLLLATIELLKRTLTEHGIPIPDLNHTEQILSANEPPNENELPF